MYAEKIFFLLPTIREHPKTTRRKIMKQILLVALLLLSLNSFSKKNSCCEGTCSGGANCTACTTCGYCHHCNGGGTCSVCRPDLYNHRTIVHKKKIPAKHKKIVK